MSMSEVNQRKFALGQTVTTPSAMGKIDTAEMITALNRHMAGDWGELCQEDRDVNEEALKLGGRLMSVYRTKDAQTKFWVITEADRSVTTILLPEEY